MPKKHKNRGLCPHLFAFEKAKPKLLIKCNYIAFFGTPFAMLLKPSLGGRLINKTLHLIQKSHDKVMGFY